MPTTNIAQRGTGCQLQLLPSGDTGSPELLDRSNSAELRRGDAGALATYAALRVAALDFGPPVSPGCNAISTATASRALASPPAQPSAERIASLTTSATAPAGYQGTPTPAASRSSPAPLPSRAQRGQPLPLHPANAIIVVHGLGFHLGGIGPFWRRRGRWRSQVCGKSLENRIEHQVGLATILRAFLIRHHSG
jgi:hypothetical protein